MPIPETTSQRIAEWGERATRCVTILLCGAFVAAQLARALS